MATTRLRRQTMELQPGDELATAKIFRDFVKPAAPNARGVWRTVEDVAINPVDTKAEPDRIVFFTDGTRAPVKTTQWWAVKA